jgi:mycofactocin system glycosyltransferase
MELTRHLADPAVALVGPRIVGRMRSPRPRWFERYDAATSSLTLGSRPSTVRPGAAVAWLPSACLVGRTELLAPGFDATMRVGEDVDLVWRLTDAGHRVRYAPETLAHHDLRSSVKGWLGRKFVYGTGGAPLAQRHGSYTAPAVLSPTMTLAGAALLLRRRWSLALVAVALSAATRSVQRSLPQSVDRTTRARVAASMSVRGVGWAVRQESALLLRHWWPLSFLGICSRSVRRAVATALVVDTCLAIAQTTEPGPSLPVRLVARRLDDLAYGAGLWWGALIGRPPPRCASGAPASPAQNPGQANDCPDVDIVSLELRWSKVVRWAPLLPSR